MLDYNSLKMQWVNAYCDFYRVNQRQPKISRVIYDNEHRLAQWRVSMKTSDKGIGHAIPLNDEQKTIVLFVDPNFFENRDSLKMQWVNAYCDFYRVNQRQPKISRVIHDNEHRLAQWRVSMKKADKGQGTSRPLNDEQKEIVLSVDPNFFQ